MAKLPIAERVLREKEHGKVILSANEDNWGWNTPAGSIRKQRRVDFLLPDTRSIEALNVLEVGCGTGTFTESLAKNYPSLTCVDVSDYLLEIARQRFPSVKFLNQDIHRTSFPDGSFDLVIGCSVLHHLDWEVALREISRILRPGGKLRFSEPNKLNPQIFLQKSWPWLKKRMGDSPDETAFTPGQIEGALKSAGFTKIVAVPYEFLHPATPPGWIPGVVRLESWLERSPLKLIAGSIRISAEKPLAR